MTTKSARILRVAIEFGWLDRDQEDLGISRYNREGDQVALQAAREGAVLLKNDGNLLPLKKDEVKSVLVVGPDAYPAVPVGGGSARAVPFQAVSFLQGISDYVGNSGKVYYSPGIPTVQQMAHDTTFSTTAVRQTARPRSGIFHKSRFAGDTLPLAHRATC